MKNCKYDELNWAELCLKTDCYQRLMEVASEMTQYRHESSMEITGKFFFQSQTLLSDFDQI